MKNQKVLIAAAALIVLIAVLAGVYFTARPATVAGYYVEICLRNSLEIL